MCKTAAAFTVDPASGPLPTAPGASTPRRVGRRRLWQVERSYLCQLIGTCLDTRAVREVARKAGYDDAGLHDYQVHHACVHAADDRHHPLARGLQKRLESEHASDVRRFSRLRTSEALREAWDEAREAGDIAGALWALHTHATVDDALLQHLFGEVHMLQHECGFREASQRRRLTKAQARIVELEAAAELERTRHEARAAAAAGTIASLRDELAALRAERARAARPANVTAHGLAAAEARGVRQATLIESLREREAARRTAEVTLTAERDAAREDVARLERLLASVLERREAPGPDDVPRASLCGRCVLVIGGQAHQCRHFRALVEANEGVFLHHDGGVEDKLARVAELVGRADAVLCPTEQVSHDAMRRAKRLCRSGDKPMIFMQRSSLAAFANGLEQVSVAAG